MTAPGCTPTPSHHSLLFRGHRLSLVRPAALWAVQCTTCKRGPVWRLSWRSPITPSQFCTRQLCLDCAISFVLHLTQPWRS
jgi:hypothetical protein